MSLEISDKLDDSKEWACVCGNILGIMHRDNNRVMVLDQFRMVVPSSQVEIIVKMGVPANYAIRNLVVGDVICPNCGRTRPWDGKEMMILKLMKRLGLEEQYVRAISKGKREGN